MVVVREQQLTKCANIQAWRHQHSTLRRQDLQARLIDNKHRHQRCSVPVHALAAARPKIALDQVPRAGRDNLAWWVVVVDSGHDIWVVGIEERGVPLVWHA